MRAVQDETTLKVKDKLEGTKSLVLVANLAHLLCYNYECKGEQITILCRT